MAQSAPPKTLRDLVAGIAAKGDIRALMAIHGDDAQTLSYGELGAAAMRLAGAFAAAGLKRQEPVILFGPNSADWIIVRLALAAFGAQAVAFDDLLTDEEVSTLVPDSGAQRAFVAAAHVPRLRSMPEAQHLEIHCLDRTDDAPAPHWASMLDAGEAPLPPIEPDDPHMLVYTSGTTGRPKSFLLTHANNLHNILALVEQGIVTADDRVLMPLPLHHVYPLTVGLLTSLASGSVLVLPEAVDGPRIVKAMQLGRATIMVAVPRLYSAMLAGLEARVAGRGTMARRSFRIMMATSLWLRRRLGIRVGRRLFSAVHRNLSPDMWLLASGGARFEADLIWRLEALGWDVRSGWGLAETASILTNNGGGRNKRIGTEGRPLRGVEVRVADPDGDGVGELQARGPSVFTGYVDNPEANATAFTDDGWFRTGDLGRIDDSGFVNIAGRVKEMIVLGGGKNVFPEELEKVYGDSPLIEEMAVLEQDGALVGLVVPNTAALANAGTTLIEDAIRVPLIEKAQSLPSFQRLAGVAVTQQPLPRNRLGKYQRFLLGDIYRRAKTGASRSVARALSPEDRDLLATSPAAEVWQFLQNRYPDHNLHPDTSLQLDLAIDSLEWVTLSLEMAERLGVQFDEEDAASVFTVRDLLNRAGERIGDGKAPTLVSAPGAGLTEAQAAWLEPPGLGARLLGRILYTANAALIRGAFRLRVSGREHLPDDGPVIIACNHVSDLDPLVVGAALGYRRLSRARWSAAAERVFAGPMGRALARASRAFPVEERNPASSLVYGTECLNRGEILIWFPESWRSPTGELQRFLPGIGQLVRETGAPVIPARIGGTFEALPRHRRWPRLTRLTIAFGPALAAVDLDTAGRQAQPAVLAGAVQRAVAALGEPAQRLDDAA